MQRLTEFDLDFRKIDMELYLRLKACATHEELTAEMEKINELKQSGLLERRHANWRRFEDRAVYYELRKITEKRDRPEGMNDMRFSHRFPTGIQYNDPQIGELGDPPEPFDTDGAEPATKKRPTSKESVKGTIRKTTNAIKTPVKRQLNKWWTKIWKPLKGPLMYPAWRYILWLGLLAAPAMVGLTFYYMRDEGCGNKCLTEGG